MDRKPEFPSERVEAEISTLLKGMRSGDALPPVRELAKRYGTSTSTVSKALARLRERGEIISRGGWGTFKA
jgi:DNA-binding GntR family transcriptional regulator